MVSYKGCKSNIMTCLWRFHGAAITCMKMTTSLLLFLLSLSNKVDQNLIVKSSFLRVNFHDILYLIVVVCRVVTIILCFDRSFLQIKIVFSVFHRFHRRSTAYIEKGNTRSSNYIQIPFTHLLKEVVTFKLKDS